MESTTRHEVTDIHKPTAEMVAFFERRTHEHIDRVRACLLALADVTDHTDALKERAESHDGSKFGPQERIPYVWLTEFYRCKQDGDSFTYPNGMEALVRKAVAHHLATNRHHPDFHPDPNDMTEVDLIEMVCDWTAMSQEFEQDGGSARGWADKTIGTRVRFNEEKRRFVYEMIRVLDGEMGVGGVTR